MEVSLIKVILGSIYVLFLPGCIWSYVFFRKDEIDIIERIALSFGLSIALVPITVFWANYFLGIKINLINVSAIILLIIVLGLVSIKIKAMSKKGSGADAQTHRE